ncbi:MAG: hypothetical protein KHX55_02200 [Proteobacteria bacterium]|nr:hypothetical protein [Pseudomonadota bacterium]
MRNITRILGAALVAAGFVVGISQTALADIYWLPKYQDKVSFSKSRVNTAKNPTMYDPISCEAKGWLSEVPPKKTCSPKYMPGRVKCWSDCKCFPQYKYAKGKGVAGGCPNGKTVNDDACEGLYSGCIDCSTNSQVSSGWGTSYKSGSNVAVMTNFGTCANYYYSCNTGYTPARPAGNAYLHSGPWSWISCGANEKAINQDGSTGTPKLCQKCIPKVCADYNSGYVAANDPTMACTKINSSDVGGLDCWSCVPCGSEYQYTTSNCPSPKILGTDICNYKASTCSCPATVTCGTGITCKTQAPPGCTGCLECNPCPNLGKYTSAQCSSLGGSASQSNYEACSEKYTCCSGSGGGCPSGYVCDTTGATCSGQHIVTGCATNFKYWCTTPNTNCSTLGYTESASSCSSGHYVKCPYDTSKVHCLP